ncbi:MAG: MoxR family ATPase [Planctomycetales bacterium]|nr:MoxR family ATPase [Planctomycetales bacterium]
MVSETHTLIDQLRQNVGQAVFGKRDVVDFCLVALFAGEHVLLEDVPGVGKTLIGKAIAKSISADFCRIQFTPDLLPSDIVGSSIFDTQTSEFSFSRGPLFANVVLADEINRTPPRTQSALLEAMSDAQVTVDGQSYTLPQPFMVIATQNPFEFEGTYPLPESQLDRFLLRISVGYPEREDERRILESHRHGLPVEELKPVINRRQILTVQEETKQVRMDEAIAEYLLEIVEATRKCDELHVGVSTRGALSLYRAAQALALLDGRDYVIPDDVKRLCVPVLSHRVVAKAYMHGAQRFAVESLIHRLIADIRVPR